MVHSNQHESTTLIADAWRDACIFIHLTCTCHGVSVCLSVTWTSLSLDNSEYVRNGDYNPTRYEAMIECVQYVTNAKLNENQESVVGMLSMAGKRIEVHISPTRSVGAIMTAIAKHV